MKNGAGMMIEWLGANPVLAAGIALVLLGLVWLLLSRRRPVRRREYRDVLSEGADRAQRNTALIDAPPAAMIDAPAVAPVEMSVADGDDLTRIKGLGPKLCRLLVDLDVTSYAQIAAWTDADLAEIDSRLGAFAGRPARDAWIEQAQFLAAGDVAGYEAKFGKL